MPPLLVYTVVGYFNSICDAGTRMWVPCSRVQEARTWAGQASKGHSCISVLIIDHYVLVNVQAARRYRIYSEAVDYTGRGRSPRPV